MKTRTLIACVLAATLIGSSTSFASDSSGHDAGAYIAVDTLVVRPVCFAATIVGGALFIVSLPFAAVSKSVRHTAHALVVKPAEATFTRPLGEFEPLTGDF